MSPHEIIRSLRVMVDAESLVVNSIARLALDDPESVRILAHYRARVEVLSHAALYIERKENAAGDLAGGARSHATA